MTDYILTNLMEIINISVSLVIADVGILGGSWLKKRDEKYDESLEEFSQFVRQETK